MKVIKGFVSLTQLISNVPATTAVIGELSTWSCTYSKERGEYQDSSIPGYVLTTFSVTEAASGALTTVTQPEVLQVLSVVKNAIEYAQTNIRPYTKQDFISYVLTKLYPQLTELAFGEFVDNGTIALPAWMRWTDSETGNYFKIWLSDAKFQDEYDNYSITVVPPVDNLDDFFKSYGKISVQLSNITLPDLTDRIQAAKSSSPETFIRTLSFKRINPDNSAQSTASAWPVLIYGKAGDNIDAQKDAIVEYVLANSTHTRAEWEAILPDLFKRTEFIILPRWDKIAIPNLSLLSSLYGNMLDPVECIAYAKSKIGFYDAAFIGTNIHILPYDYKAINLLVVNGQANAAGKADLAELFPDYIPVASTTLDFARMSVATQTWALLLGRLLITAETATEFTSIPSNMRKIKRGNRLFISAVYDNVNYLVDARTNP